MNHGARTKRSAYALQVGEAAGVRTTRTPTVLSRHMGVRASVFFAIANPIALKSVAQGVATQCYLATHPAVATTSGHYFADCNAIDPHPDAEDPALARKLWDRTEAIVATLPA